MELSKEQMQQVNESVENGIPYVIKKNGMYYAHNSCGYVHRVLMAELFTEEYAKRHANSCEDCEAIPITALLTGLDEVEQYLERMTAMRDVMLAVVKASGVEL